MYIALCTYFVVHGSSHFKKVIKVHKASFAGAKHFSYPIAKGIVLINKKLYSMNQTRKYYLQFW